MVYPYGFMSGRYINESGEIVNMANYYDAQTRSCVACNIFNGKIHSATHRFTIPGGSTYYIACIVPEGVKVFISSRTLALCEGEYNVDVIDADFNVNSGTLMTIAPLNQDSGVQLQSSFRAGVTEVTNEQVLEYGYIDAGHTQGVGRPSTVLNSDQVFKIITRNTLLKIQKLDSGDVTINATIIFWEINGE